MESYRRFRVFIGRPDMLARVAKVWVIDGDPEDPNARAMGPGGSWGPLSPDAEPEPSMLLPVPALAEFYIALGEMFDHGAGTTSLRKDYDAERARVDRLIGIIGREQA